MQTVKIIVNVLMCRCYCGMTRCSWT